MDKQRRLIMPKPWRLSTDKIAKSSAKEDEGDSSVSTEGLTPFYLMPWTVEGKQVIYVFDVEEMAHVSANWENISPFSNDAQAHFMDYASRIQMVTMDSQWRFQLNTYLTKYAGLDPLRKDGVAFSGSWRWGLLLNADDWDADAPMNAATLSFMGEHDAHQKVRQEQLENVAASRGVLPPGTPLN